MLDIGLKIALRGDTLSFLALFTCQHLEGTIPIDIGLARIGRRFGIDTGLAKREGGCTAERL